MAVNNYDDRQSYEHFLRGYWWLADGLLWFSLPLLCWGVYLVLYQTPPDYQMGDNVRWLFPHVASAFTAMVFYLSMAGLAAWSLYSPDPVRKIMMLSIAPIGAGLTFIAIITGMMWSKPVWGAWWVWDVRTGSTLILLGFYLCISLLGAQFANKRMGYFFLRLVILVGLIVVFIVHIAPEYTNTLHQAASLSNFKFQAYPPDYLRVLSFLCGGTAVFSIGLILLKTKNNVLGAMS